MEWVIKFFQCKDVKKPERAHNSDSWIDFFVPNDLLWVKVTPEICSPWRKVAECHDWSKELLIMPGEWLLIPSWIHMIIPEWYDLVFENKSSIASKYNLMIWAKVVDSSYRGEVHLHIVNVWAYKQTIKLGQKIAQGIVRKVELCKMEEVDKAEFDSYCNTERGVGGFGSTGS